MQQTPKSKRPPNLAQHPHQPRQMPVIAPRVIEVECGGRAGRVPYPPPSSLALWRCCGVAAEEDVITLPGGRVGWAAGGGGGWLEEGDLGERGEGGGEGEQGCFGFYGELGRRGGGVCLLEEGEEVQSEMAGPGKGVKQGLVVGMDELKEKGGGESFEEEDVFCEVAAEEAAVLESEGVWEEGGERAV